MLYCNSVGHKCRNNFNMRLREVGVGGRGVTDGQVTDHTGGFWEIQEVLPGDRFACLKVETEREVTGFAVGLGVDTPWHLVGIVR